MSSLFGIGGGGNVGASGSFYDYEIENSVRMSDASNSQIYWSAGTPSSGNIWTASFWFKKYSVGAGQAANEMFGAGSSGAAYMFWAFDGNDKFTFQSTADGNKGATTGSPVFRDVSAWSHMVIRADTTQSTQADRLRVYLNGEQLTTWGTDSIGTSTWNYINQSGFNQYWGGASGIANGNPGCNFYLADINFCDGQSYDASYFGEDKNGIWVPIDPSVTYGNNGYRLEFKQTGTSADASGIGADTSGNGNHFTIAGITAEDIVLDSPSANWATMNPLYPGVGITYYEGNLKLSASSGFSTTAYGSQSTIAIPKDKKVYIEIEETVTEGNVWSAGIATANDKPNSTLVGGPQSITVYNRQVYVNGVENDYGASAGLGGLGSTRLQAGDILGIAVDGSTGEVWFAQNNSWFKTPTTNDSGTVGDPSAGTNPIGTISNPKDEDLFLVVSGNGASNIWINFGQDTQNIASAESDANELGTFEYAPPTDHVCLATPSLTEPAIGPNSTEQADDNFSAVIYTGDNSQSVTGIGFQPDLVWVKTRDHSYNHQLHDSVRGATAGALFSNSSGAETAFEFDSFDSDGFTTDSGNITGINATGDSQVAWNWKAGGTAVSNTSGSITSSVSANSTAGVSIVTYTGAGTGTVGHGLGATPSMYIVKCRSNSATNWRVYNKHLASDAETDYLTLDSTATKNDATFWNDTAPTDDVFSVFNFDDTGTSGRTYVAYVFADVEGFSKFGSYEGNSSGTNGPFVYTGFAPSLVLGKAIDQTGRWWMYDSARSPQMNYTIGTGAYIAANSTMANGSQVEASDSGVNAIQLLSNGFKVNTTNGEWNGNNLTYIYLAFADADGPFKYSRAR